MLIFQMLMMWLLDIRCILLCLVAFLVFRWLFGKPTNLPPGPRGLPFVGSLPAIALNLRGGKEPHVLFEEYAAKYGPVFSVKVLNKTVVVLSDYASVKEAFQNVDLCDRPKMANQGFYKSQGVGGASGEIWEDLRRFTVTILRSLGVGKSIFADNIAIEAEELCKAIGAFEGRAFDPKSLIMYAVANVICSVVLGKRYDYTDQEFSLCINLMERNFKLIGAGGFLIFLPMLRHLPFGPMKKLLTNMKANRDFLGGAIDAHRASYDPDNLRDFIDVYLMEMQRNNSAETETFRSETIPSSSSSSYRHLTEDNFIGTLGSLFVAGSETTGTTLQWAILFMVVYPDIQQQVHAEIDAVVGRARLPKLADRPELNFTQAVIWEVQRRGSIGPFGFPHAAATDTKFRNFIIPQGSIVVPNLGAIFSDPSLWQNPDEFNPGRFLNEDGKAVKVDELIPFSIGRRNCPGEMLAKMELFIIFSHLMHQFTFKQPDNSPPLTLTNKGGLSRCPEAFEICAIIRLPDEI